ncbi:MAG: hypothetical protein LQ343_007793 [Gyalolechia ehrenbergii]|nr:MAG: hypothetical protein LQ343_007793 [Gyalolechia ehrenbergii]
MSEKLKRDHDAAVGNIADTIRQFAAQGQKFRIKHGSTNSTRPTTAKGRHFVDTGKLSRVLEVDEARKTCLVEPNVPMDQLVKATLPHGLVPPVVMEFPGITVGGGFSGTSAESSSFKYGFFDRTVQYVEMVLANGDVVVCSNDENKDLLQGAAGAMGTFGVVTLLELRLITATKFVRLSYVPVKGVPEAVETLQKLIRDDSMDYLDGILFSQNQGAIISGQMTDQRSEDETIQTFSKSKDPWFYLHAQKMIRDTTSTTTQLVPLTDYLFRYDRGAFWTGSYAFTYFKTPFNRFTRRFFDDFFHTRVMYKAADASQLLHQYIAQDLALPFPRATEFIEYTVRSFGIWPLWLCPLKPTPYVTLNPFPGIGNGASEPILNVGLWGQGPKSPKAFVAANKDLERKLVELGGVKALYAHTYYTEDEFWRVYDREWYDALREKYNARSLPSAHDKVKVAVDVDVEGRGGGSLRDRVFRVRPMGGLYGVFKAWRSEEYREARRSKGR